MKIILKFLSNSCFAVVWLVVLLVVTGCQKNAATADPVVELPKLTGILSTLQMAHPRLLLTDARLQELKTMSATDDRLKKYASDVIAQADKDIFKSPILHVLVGSDCWIKAGNVCCGSTTWPLPIVGPATKNTLLQQNPISGWCVPLQTGILLIFWM